MQTRSQGATRRAPRRHRGPHGPGRGPHGPGRGRHGRGCVLPGQGDGGASRGAVGSGRLGGGRGLGDTREKLLPVPQWAGRGLTGQWEQHCTWTRRRGERKKRCRAHTAPRPPPALRPAAEFRSAGPSTEQQSRTPVRGCSAASSSPGPSPAADCGQWTRSKGPDALDKAGLAAAVRALTVSCALETRLKEKRFEDRTGCDMSFVPHGDHGPFFNTRRLPVCHRWTQRHPHTMCAHTHTHAHARPGTCAATRSRSGSHVRQRVGTLSPRPP